MKRRVEKLAEYLDCFVLTLSSGVLFIWNKGKTDWDTNRQILLTESSVNSFIIKSYLH